MLINSEINLYRKLLKENYEDYDKKMENLAEYFEKGKESLNLKYKDVYYISGRYDNLMSLNLIDFGFSTKIDISLLDDIGDSLNTSILKNFNFDFNSEDEKKISKSYSYSMSDIDKYKIKLVYYFVIKNIKKDYFDRGDYPLHNDLQIIDVNDSSQNYIILGYFAPGTDEDQIDYDDESLIIVDNEPNETINNFVHHIWEKDGIFVIIQSIKRLQFNILKHISVPKHVLLSEEEKIQLYKKYYIQSNADLPTISRYDAVAQILCMRPGMVCCIHRKSKTAVVTYYYRVCV